MSPLVRSNRCLRTTCSSRDIGHVPIYPWSADGRATTAAQQGCKRGRILGRSYVLSTCTMLFELHFVGHVSGVE